MHNEFIHSTDSDVALIVHTCDRYAFLYKGFEIFFQKHWDFSINCSYYFATEEADVAIKGFETIHSGKGEWADRLAFLLREKLREKYVLYFQEDMWLNKRVNGPFFNRLFELARQNDWQQVKLHSAPNYTTTATDLFIEGFRLSVVDNEASQFLMSHQVTLWNKEFLLKQLHKGEHPWRNERKGTKRLRKLNPQIFHLDYFAENGSAAINENKSPVLRSEYQAISINGTLNGNVVPYIEVLKGGNAEEQDYAARLEHNYHHNLTHDGKPKPRKVDIFKRIKNWLQGK